MIPGGHADAATNTLLFVYGSLKRGEINHALLLRQRFIAPARTTGGYRLYELDGYPGMVHNGDPQEFVTGELWAVSADCVQQLDPFEGTDVGLYRRERVPLSAPHQHTAAEAYIYAQPIEGRKQLGHTWKGG